MKTGNIDLKPLRELATSGFDKFAREHPESAQGAGQLKEATLSIFAADNADFDTIDRLFPVMNARADELDVDVFLYAFTQELIEKMNRLARKTLSQGVPVFPEFAVKLTIPAKGARSKPALGSRTRLGGAPQWVQGDDTPVCKNCQRAMTFVAQIDSIAMLSDDVGKLAQKKESFMFADAGMIYVFWCSGCMETESITQCG